MNFFLEGKSGLWIHEHLKVPANRVWEIYRKYGFSHAGVCGHPKGNIPAFVTALQERRNYIKHLAKQFGVAVQTSQKIAHEVLGCPEFRPGASKPPLSSNFPQKWFDIKMAGPGESIELVQHILDKCFAGKFPAVDDDRFVAAIMDTFSMNTLQGQPQIVLDSFAAQLREAVSTLRLAEQGQVN